MKVDLTLLGEGGSTSEGGLDLIRRGNLNDEG